MLADDFRKALETAIAFGEREGIALLCAEVFDLKMELERVRSVHEILEARFEAYVEEMDARLESLRKVATRPTSCSCCEKC